MLYVFCLECRDKILRNKRYNAYSVVATHGKCPRVDFAFARQPWAIKRTTPTALCNEGISIAKHIHWNTGITPTALRGERIHCDRRIHRNIGTTLITLHGCNIQMMRCFLLFHVQSLHKTADDFRLSGVFSEVFGELTCVIIVGPTLCYF